jgi:hypothetical protein
MRPSMGKVSASTASARSDKPVFRRELIPRSERARLIDWEMLDVTSDVRRSKAVSYKTSKLALPSPLTRSQFVDFDFMTAHCCIKSSKRAHRTRSNDQYLLGHVSKMSILIKPK